MKGLWQGIEEGFERAGWDILELCLSEEGGWVLIGELEFNVEWG